MIKKSLKRKGDRYGNHIRSHGGVGSAGQGGEKSENEAASTGGSAGQVEQTGSAEKAPTAEVTAEKEAVKNNGPGSSDAIKYNKQSASQESTELSRSKVILEQYARNPTDADLRSELRSRGLAVLEASNALTQKYLYLCDWIVEKQLTPEMVNDELKRVGFDKSRISEIKRVCFTSSQIYAEFKKRLYGWKVALKKARSKRMNSETDHTRWLRLFREFEKQFLRCSPPEPFYRGNGKNLFMWSDSDVSTAMEQKCGPWVVTVRAK